MTDFEPSADYDDIDEGALLSHSYSSHLPYSENVPYSSHLPYSSHVPYSANVPYSTDVPYYSNVPYNRHHKHAELRDVDQGYRPDPQYDEVRRRQDQQQRVTVGYDNPSFIGDDYTHPIPSQASTSVYDKHNQEFYDTHDYNSNKSEIGVGSRREGIEEYLPSKLTRRRSKSRRKSHAETKRKDIQHLSAHEQAELYRTNLMKAQVTGGDELDALKYKGTKAYRSFRVKAKDALSRLEIWSSSFKEIEGHFGTGVLQFFRFVKIIFHINIWISLITFFCICIPQLVLSPGTFLESTQNLNRTSVSPQPLQNPTSGNLSAQLSFLDYITEAETCTVQYAVKVSGDINKTANSVNVLVDFLQGTGWMERTLLFYGYYFNKTYYSEVEMSQTVFNMPLAFLLCSGAYFLISLIIMLNSMASGLTESITSRSDSNVNFCNKVFCGWDFALNDSSIAKLKKKNLKNEFESDLAEEKRKLERTNRTAAMKAQLYTVRFFINLLVMAVLAGSFALIFFVTNEQSKLLEKTSDEFVRLLIQFMPSLTITALFFILPIGFGFLVEYEKYSPEFEIEISLIRIVFVRLASLAVLVITAYIQIGGECKKDAPKQCANCRTDGIWCWETYIGQQIYKLVILDFLVHVGVTIVEFIRKAVVQRWFHVKLFKLVGHAEFYLPVNVLDIVYTQTLCWFGAFFSPLIPAITLVKVFAIFYMKKYSLLINQKPSRRPYRASSSYLFFLVILLIAFAMTAVFVGWAIGRIPPSQSCGPFRIYSEGDFFMFKAVTNTINSWPMVPKAIFTTIGSAAVYIPVTVILILLIFYYFAVASGHNKMIKLLEAQLGLEGKDKQFLLARVNNALIHKGR